MGLKQLISVEQRYFLQFYKKSGNLPEYKNCIPQLLNNGKHKNSRYFLNIHRAALILTKYVVQTKFFKNVTLYSCQEYNTVNIIAKKLSLNNIFISEPPQKHFIKEKNLENRFPTSCTEHPPPLNNIIIIILIKFLFFQLF